MATIKLSDGAKIFWKSNRSFLKFSFSEKATKILRNLPHGFDIYLVNVKTMRKIAQIFVAFSEKPNFNSKFRQNQHDLKVTL